jgi:hypothetical protein
MEWLEANSSAVFDIPIKIGLFGSGVLFLQTIGIDDAMAKVILRPSRWPSWREFESVESREGRDYS